MENSVTADNTSQRSEETGPASLSSLEELTSGLLKRATGGRRRLEKQVSETIPFLDFKNLTMESVSNREAITVAPRARKTPVPKE